MPLKGHGYICDYQATEEFHLPLPPPRLPRRPDAIGTPRNDPPLVIASEAWQSHFFLFCHPEGAKRPKDLAQDGRHEFAEFLKMGVVVV